MWPVMASNYPSVVFLNPPRLFIILEKCDNYNNNNNIKHGLKNLKVKLR
jgi:hypothetical protein